ncbi:MAG: ABC transporter substrate-binding protein [Armatimonadota bacterium]|nr:ABC transporter substrate-binding protein [Armatimonadota bacterium]MDR5704403.1 ABC transporter substrate-binding protein [Armatimonadota bacterium]MDR7435849.1 ABC transporter substrate-binding protein [Armatimonadota bacterium]
MRERVFLVGGAVLLAIVLTACAPRAPTEIKIGLNAELTGSIPVVGASCKNAAEMAVEEVNAAGGLEVGGKKYKVTLLVEDNEDKAESAAAAAQKLNTAGVLLMIGPNASRNAIPASEVAESNKMPMISPWSTNPKTTLDPKTGQPKKYVFRAAFIDDFQGQVAAKFAITELKTKRPAVLYDVASEYNKGIAEIYKKTLEENGIQVVAFETYTTGDKDFSAQLTKIKEAGADTLFLPNYYSEVPLQVQQAHKLGFKGIIFGSDSWGNLELITLCGKDCEGLFFTTHYATDIATPKAQQFIKAYEAKYGKTPDDVAALTYDSFGLAFQAIKAAGKLDREAIRNALASITEYEGVTGVMQFKGTGDPIKSAVIIQIREGKFRFHSVAKP